MPTPNTKRKNQASGILLPLAIVLIGLVAGYYYYTTINLDTPALAEQNVGNFDKFAQLRLDFSVFSKTAFQSLKIFGENPVEPLPGGGKQDLFSQ